MTQKYTAQLKVLGEYRASYLMTQALDPKERLEGLEINSKYSPRADSMYQELQRFTEAELKELNIWGSDQWNIEPLVFNYGSLIGNKYKLDSSWDYQYYGIITSISGASDNPYVECVMEVTSIRTLSGEERQYENSFPIFGDLKTGLYIKYSGSIIWL